jgi:thiamine pyrophosphate-dependent acetolactate synthase large subunit-like protein
LTGFTKIVIRGAVKRFECLKEIAGLVGDALVVVCVGGTSSEWNAYRPSDGNLRCWTLGLTSSVALGMAVGLPHRRVIALDGDGSLLMNLCGLPTIMRKKPKNLIHVVFDNGIYESSGGTKTATADGVDFGAVAKGVGIKNASSASSVAEFKKLFTDALARWEHTFISARVEPGRGEVPPWPWPDVENKYRFSRFVEETEGISIFQARVPGSWKKS